MKERDKKIIEKSIMVTIAVIISVFICNYFNLSKFYAGIAALNVINLNDARTRKQAYERTIATCSGGIIAWIITYSGFRENMILYIVGLTIVCLTTEFILNIPSTVGCIAFTYIMLNIDPQKNPQNYIVERVIATFIGALIVSIIVTLYNQLRKKTEVELNKREKQPATYHIKKGVIPGVAVVSGFFIVTYLNKYINSKYVTNYTLYYCALASIVTFHTDIRELIYKSKERLISSILGGLLAFLFLALGLTSTFWTGIGVGIIIIIIEIFIKVSASLGGIVFLFIILNMNEELTPLVYYIDRIAGTTIGIILILLFSYLISFIREIIVKNKIK